jgi:hypothetical protein
MERSVNIPVRSFSPQLSGHSTFKIDFSQIDLPFLLVPTPQSATSPPEHGAAGHGKRTNKTRSHAVPD